MKMNEDQFRQALRDEGYGEAASLECDANMSGDLHTHDFSAYAMVMRGEFTVVLEDGAVTHHPGETCKVPAGTRHAEQTGAIGATLLIGKK
jgi:quercetin dioxygenase-like cupin family protein